MKLQSQYLKNYNVQDLRNFVSVIPQIMDIADMAIQVGGAREGQSFVLKI
jgi:hypothetical protein